MWNAELTGRTSIPHSALRLPHSVFSSPCAAWRRSRRTGVSFQMHTTAGAKQRCRSAKSPPWPRSEEHTSELQSRLHLVCRLLLEKKNRHYLGDRPVLHTH